VGSTFGAYLNSCGLSLREKVIDVSRRLSKSALSLQMCAGQGDTVALGIEDRDLITVVALVVKYKLVSVMVMCTGCHLDLLYHPVALWRAH
jgi:positive regulator of sigma E activity